MTMTVQSPTTWPPGFRINPRAAGPSRELIEAFREIPVAVAGDCMGRCTGTVGLRHYHGDTPAVICGPALTVRVRPGDNLMIHKAMFLAERGDVIVVDGAGDLSQALVGGLMRTSAVAKGLGGFVLDGAVRDTAEWAEGGMPMFARGHTHRGLAYLEATTEDSWCVDLCRTGDKAQHCVLSHVLNFAGIEGLDYFEERWATTSMIFPVNDGQHEHYQQATPKARCVAYLSDLRDGKEKCAADYLGERNSNDAPDQFWRQGTTYSYVRVRQPTSNKT